METSDAVVVGGGAVGCATAFWLARAGLTVTVLERDSVAQHASSCRMSGLAPLDAGARGVLVEAGFESLDVLREVQDELEEVSGIELHTDDRGWLRLGDAIERDARYADSEILSRFGCRWMERSELDALDSRFDERWVGGLWSPQESRVDASRLTRAFAAGAAHYGARFEWNTPATGLAMAAGCVGGVLADSDRLFAAGDVVICAGAWTAEVAVWLGAALPVVAESGEMYALPAPSRPLPCAISGPGVSLLPGEDQLWVRSDASHATGSAPSALSDWRRDADALVAGIAAEPDETWVGSAAELPDGMPLVGRVAGVEGAAVATGHGRHGVLLAALTAAGIVELLVEGKVSEDIEAFSPDRLEGRGAADAG